MMEKHNVKSKDKPSSTNDTQYEVCPCGARCLKLDQNWILSEPVKNTQKPKPVEPSVYDMNIPTNVKSSTKQDNFETVYYTERDIDKGYVNPGYRPSSEMSLDPGDTPYLDLENQVHKNNVQHHEIQRQNPLFYFADLYETDNIQENINKTPEKDTLNQKSDVITIYQNDLEQVGTINDLSQNRGSKEEIVVNQNVSNWKESIEENDKYSLDNDNTEKQSSSALHSPTAQSTQKEDKNEKSKQKSKIKLKFGRKSKKKVELDEDEKWLRWVQKKFQEIAGEDGEIDLEEFKGALKVKKSFFAERFFSLFDQDKSGSIEMNELMEGLHMLTKGSPKQKLKFLFDVYDVDGSGCIDPDELKTVLKSCMDESSLSLSDEALDELTMTLFESADEDKSGEITYEELVAELEKHPGVIENLTISAANWLRPPEKKKKNMKPRYLTWNYISNNVRKVVFLFVYLMINAGLVTFSAYRYRTANWTVITARGCGMALNFNCAFILVLMLRNCLTWLRTTKLGPYLPLDQSIMFHKLVGFTTAFLASVHTLAHLANLGYIHHGNKDAPANTTVVEYWEYLFTLKGGIGWIPGFAFLSGVALDVILAIMVLCSLPCVRRSGHFQIFYWTHMLYVFFWILLILHGPIFWYFFIVPGFIFIVEKIINSKLMKLARYGKVYVKEVNLLPSKVTHLVVARPNNFRYKAGDYIFINIPVIAEYEWHPFTISSAPEMSGEIWLHVRSAGHWTGKLYEYFDKYEPLEDNVFKVDMENGHVGKEVKFKGNGNVYHVNGEASIQPTKFNSISDGRGSVKKDKKKERHKKVKVQVYIDGPYGTATREIFETEHVVLIGSGIGVTPFASILQSVMYRYNMARSCCPKCDHIWYGQIPANVMKLKKLDFIWINRDQRSFEWFVSLLAKLEMQQTEGDSESESSFDRFLEMQMYMTSALTKSDMKGMALQMAMEMMHKKGGKDVVTGLKTRTQPGRPKWSEVFKKVSSEGKGKPKVFFCGSPLLGKTLKEQCQKFGLDFAKENF